MLNPDRRYSLCITPEDYEPEEIPDWHSLTELADLYKTDKGNIKHLYTPVYERLMGDNAKPVELLEIGVACGASLKMWHTYFHNGNITGLDIRPECAEMCKGYPRVKIVVGDANTYNPGKQFDFVIDDGSHVSVDIVRTFESLWKHVKPGGLYIVEDMKCTHNPQYVELFEWPRKSEDFSRRHIIVWLDNLLRKMDNRLGDVEFVQFYKEMMVLGKKC